jgi:RHS repeat-associated protein
LSDVSRGHDALGRLTNETQTLFDAHGQSVFQHQIAHRLGLMGQREATTLSGGGLLGEVGYLTYGSGHLHGVTLDQEQLLSIERDDLHREVTRHIPALSLKRAYDTMGRLQTQVVDGLTEGLSRFNNPATQDPVLKTLAAPAPLLAAQLNRHYHYDKLGQMVGITSPTNAQDVYKRYAYDPAGRLIASIHAGQDKQTNYRFDPAGNRLPDPIPAQYQNKAQDWAEQVKQNLHNPEFDVLSQDASLFKPESVDRWMDNRVRHSAGTRYEYDRWGNRTQAMHLDGKRQKYSYDGLHQLTQVQCFEGADLISTTRYRYDVFGRRLAKIVQEAPAKMVDAQGTRDSNAQSSQQPMPAAAPPPPKTTHYGWDGDRLAHIETDTTIQATIYEPDSFVPMLMIHIQKPKLPAAPAELQAMEKEFPAVMQELITTGQIPSGTRELMGKLGLDAEHISAQVQEFKQAQQEALDQAPMSIHHFYCDHLGTPRALFDLHGSPVWLAEYDDWGSVTKEYNPLNLEQPIRFQGQHIDEESGLFYNFRRYYDSKTCSYINQDPIGLNGALNLYIYPRNPIAYIDPLGLEPEATTSGGLIGNLFPATMSGLARDQSMADQLRTQAAMRELNANTTAATAAAMGAGYGGARAIPVVAAALTCRSLDKEKKIAKSIQNALGGCKGTDSEDVLKTKKAALLTEVAIRELYDAKCHQGGNTGHRDQTQQKKAAIQNCDKFLNKIK